MRDAAKPQAYPVRLSYIVWLFQGSAWEIPGAQHGKSETLHVQFVAIET
jgi:hypothetical protein